MATTEATKLDSDDENRSDELRVVDQNPFEKIGCHVFLHARHVSRKVAERIADCIRTKAAQGENCVLGLATGSTPVGVYNELVRMHHEAVSYTHLTLPTICSV